MLKTKILTTLFILTFIIFPAITHADEPDIEEVKLEAGIENLIMAENALEPDQEAINDEVVTAIDLEVNEVKKIPSKWGLFMQNIGERINVTLTFDKVKKAEKRLHLANKKIAQANFLFQNSDDPKIQARAENLLEKANTAINKIDEKIDDLKTVDNDEFKNFIGKYSEKVEKQHKILDQLESKVPEHAFVKIKQAKEQRLEHLKNVFERIDNNDPEKIKERLTKIFETKEGSNLKPINDLEFIKKLKEKFPKDNRLFERAEEERCDKFTDKFKQLDQKEAEAKLKKYLNTIINEKNKEIILNRRTAILDDIRDNQGITFELKEKLRQVKSFTENRLEKHRELDIKKQALKKKALIGDEKARQQLKQINLKEDKQFDEKQKKIMEFKSHRQDFKAGQKEFKQEIKQDASEFRQNVKQKTANFKQGAINKQELRQGIIHEIKDLKTDFIEERQEKRQAVQQEKNDLKQYVK